MILDIPADATDAILPSSTFELRHASTHRPILVTVPARRFLAINGAGPRAAADFRWATAVLRTVASNVRRIVSGHSQPGPLRSVLEVTWAIGSAVAADEVVEALSSPAPRWRQMVELPQAATASMAAEGIDQARRSGGRRIPLVRPIELVEGPAVQLLRLGDEDELAAIRKLIDAVTESGLRASGDLHELVIADREIVGARRARSILRVPIAVG